MPDETLLTASGDRTRVISVLPRPGPEPVYNLEIDVEHVYYVSAAGILAHNATPLGCPPDLSKVRFVDDVPNMGKAARKFEDAALGARSRIATKRRQVPVLDRTLPDGKKAAVKFDGIDGNVLIDRKIFITTFPKSKSQALRQAQALSENGLSGRWEVPSLSQASRARKLLRDLGIKNIDVGVVP